MKPLHIGLLVIGAALAGGLAMRMAEPPALPPVFASPVPSRPKPILTPVSKSVEAPQVTAKRNAQVSGQPPAGQELVIAPAPPPIYSEPPHIQQPPRRSPFVAPPPKQPVEVARAEPPTVIPAPYRPEPKVEPVPVEPPITQSPVRDAEPPHVEQPPRQVVIQAGAPITVRLIQTLSSEKTLAGDIFQATLADPLIADGFVVAEKGARVTGRVVDAHKAGHLSGAPSLELRLLDFITSDGQRIPVTSDPWLKRGDSGMRGAAEKIGGGAALGAVIGAIAGGGPGAAIGAGAGGIGGTGAAIVSGGKPLTIPSETVIRFRLASKVSITERRL